MLGFQALFSILPAPRIDATARGWTAPQRSPARTEAVLDGKVLVPPIVRGRDEMAVLGALDGVTGGWGWRAATPLSADQPVRAGTSTDVGVPVFAT